MINIGFRSVEILNLLSLSKIITIISFNIIIAPTIINASVIYFLLFVMMENDRTLKNLKITNKINKLISIV